MSDNNAYASNVYVPGQSQPSSEQAQTNPLMEQFKASQQAQKLHYEQTHSHVESSTPSTPTPSAATVEVLSKGQAQEPPKPNPATTYTGPPKPNSPKPTNPTATSTSTSTNSSTTSAATPTFGGNDEASFKKEFEKIDVDHSGFIDQQELSKLFMGMIPEKFLKKALKFVDTNKDGKISLDEYVAIRKQVAKFVASK